MVLQALKNNKAVAGGLDFLVKYLETLAHTERLYFALDEPLAGLSKRFLNLS